MGRPTGRKQKKHKENLPHRIHKCKVYLFSRFLNGTTLLIFSTILINLLFSDGKRAGLSLCARQGLPRTNQSDSAHVDHRVCQEIRLTVHDLRKKCKLCSKFSKMENSLTDSELCEGQTKEVEKLTKVATF